ncbi:MAG: GfdT protein [Rhodobacteraceae bacterium]|nr:GfdT protein [Paracoccaceae bacterium]
MNRIRDMAGLPVRHGQIVRTAFADCHDDSAVERLVRDMGSEGLDLVILFMSPNSDLNKVLAEATEAFAPAHVIGCTTAGELSEHGYSEDEIVAIGLPSSHFQTRTILIEDLTEFQAQPIIDRMIRNRNQMAWETPDWGSEFALLLVDGLSLREDELTSQLALGLGNVPLFGGSAGDGNLFESTYVMHDQHVLSNAAVLVQVRSCCPIKVFKADHLVPTEKRMVVTGADPARRIVCEINAEPAAREYARILGKDPEQLTTFTFAAHPVVVRIGDQHHVRAIQQVAPNGDLVFFSAIDEGVVLTLAEPDDMVTHLEAEMSRLRSYGTPDMILGCDCILRRVESEQKQRTGEISRILADNRVVGFSTYGEQVNSMHVNQTLTGVAIYPPEEDR